MTMKNKIILGGLALFSMVSCTKNFDDMNTDKKNPTEVDGQSIYANAAKMANRQVAHLNVNYNNLKLWSQYFTQTTYTDESNYDLRTRNIPNREWQVMYRDVLQDLKEAKKFTEQESPILAEDVMAQQNRLAIIEIMSIYSYERLTSIFGNVPYTDALTGTNLPAFDDAQTIYSDLSTRLDVAIAQLDESGASFDGGYDNLFEGDVASWKKFAYGLKLKMGITISDVDPSTASSLISDAWDHVISSNSENAKFHFLGDQPNTNPIYEDLVISGRSDFVAANTIIDTMNSLGDPRIGMYYTTAPDTTAYIGGAFGASNSYGVNSHAGASLNDPMFPSTMMDYAEMEFYKAEAIEKGLYAGTAEDHYNNGITASILDWGGTAADATTYLANPDVAYTTATGDYKMKIGTQAWIAYFNRGSIAWNSIRRLDAPGLNIAENSQEDTPKRYSYPTNEQTLNSANYSSAASAIGGDLKSTRLWWDVN